MADPPPVDKLGLFSHVPEAPEYPVREKYQAHLLEQYKMYVEMMDRVSQRRQTANSYFLSINSALLASVGFITTKETNSSYLWLIGLAGIVLSILWWQIINSYKNLNTAKFKVIGEIENRLPLKLYDAEWRAVGKGKDPKRYRPLSHIEANVPWIFMVMHGYVIIRSIWK